jgi:hypothetical protein
VRYVQHNRINDLAAISCGRGIRRPLSLASFSHCGYAVNALASRSLCFSLSFLSLSVLTQRGTKEGAGNLDPGGRTGCALYLYPKNITRHFAMGRSLDNLHILPIFIGMIAALFVEKNGIYFGVDGIDPWDESRDARLYDGPYRVIAHPPCARWGMYWSGGPNDTPRKRLGDDGGCFASALHSVRKWGGVIEHPAGSHAWEWFGLNRPPSKGGWVSADRYGGMTCCVEQGFYGHMSRKRTWLYLNIGDTENLPDLMWGDCGIRAIVPKGATSDERKRILKTGICQKLSKRQRAATPPGFRDALIFLVSR